MTISSFPTHRTTRIAESPLGDISKKLSEAIKQSKGPQDEAPNGTEEAKGPKETPDTGGSEPPGGAPPPEGESPATAPSEGSGVPDLQLPSLPTEPSMTLPDAPSFPGPTAEPDSLAQVSDRMEKLERSIEELVEGLKETITTSTPAGQATLSNIPKKEGLDGENLDFGLEPTSTHPFTQPVANTRRSPMLRKQRVADIPAKRRAEDGISSTPPEGLEGLYEEPTPKVDGEKPFVTSPPKVVSEKELDNAVAQSQQEDGVAEMLYPKASELRAARKARLGLDYNSFIRVSQEGQSALFAAAERKASDMAALRVTRYLRATELAHQAQERGIVEFPLHSILSARLATYGVPDAELVAADVLEGATMESFKSAHQAALKYMAMDDNSFLHVQETIASTPKTNARGGYSSDRERTARTIRKEASEGSLPIQASTPEPQAAVESLRQTLRAGTPRPNSLSR